MSKLEELIQKYCPGGVAQYSLGELGKFYGGLTGKSKSDFTDGNAIFISYKNVYSNPSLDIHPEDRVKIAENEKQRTLEYGDVIFTGSSETPDECGFSSVVTEKPTEKLYLNSFCFFYRLNDLSIINPHFAKHLFRSGNLRYQIGKTASGVTRFNVSKDKMAKVTIPVPPLPVQEEIVRILNNFNQLTAELQAELQARKTQYEYYRKSLIESVENCPKVKIGEICNVFTGGEPPADCIKGDTPDDEHPYAVWGNGKDIYGYSGTYRIDKDAVVISSIGANTGSVYFRKAFFTPIIRLKVIVPKDSTLNMRFLYHALSATKIESKSSSVPNMNASEIKALIIPVPNITEQNRIADILDKFDALCGDLTSGLPAEIEARQKQYEYYRDKLLSFKKIGDAS